MEAASRPSHSQLVYETDNYPIYDSALNNRGPSTTGPFNTYKKYDGHALYMNPRLDATNAE